MTVVSGAIATVDVPMTLVTGILEVAFTELPAGAQERCTIDIPGPSVQPVLTLPAGLPMGGGVKAWLVEPATYRIRCDAVTVGSVIYWPTGPATVTTVASLTPIRVSVTYVRQ